MANRVERELARQRRELLKLERRVDAYLVGEYRNLYRHINTRLTELVELIEAAENPKTSWLVRQWQYQQLLNDIERETMRFAFYATRQITEGQRQLVGTADEEALKLIEAIKRPTTPAQTAAIQTAFRTLNPEAFNRLVGNASNGKPLSNLLLRIAPKAKRKAERVLTRGIAQGKNPKVVGRELMALTDETLARTQTISRTEMLRANRQATLETYRQSQVVNGWYWHAQLDTRTCFACAMMSGTTHTNAEHLDGHPNCFVSGTVVSGPRNTGSTSRWFEGQVVDVELADGNSLTCTPNHPILTTKGWVAAGLLHKGGHVVSSLGREGIPAGIDPDDYQVPSRIEDVAAAVGRSDGMTTVSVPTAPEDFHGDGFGSDVSVVRTNSLLRDAEDPAIAKPKLHQLFGGADAQLLSLAGLGAFGSFFDGLLATPNRSMSGLGVASVLLGGALCHRHTIGLGLPPDRHPVFEKDATDDGAGYALPDSQSIFRFAGNVTPNEIVSVRKRDFAGMVHNLESPVSWYIANNVIVHNCRCAMIPKTLSWEELGFKGIPDTSYRPPLGETWFDNLDDAAKRSMLGPQKLDALKTGELTKKDLIARPRSKEWGTMRRNASYREAKQRKQRQSSAA